MEIKGKSQNWQRSVMPLDNASTLLDGLPTYPILAVCSGTINWDPCEKIMTSVHILGMELFRLDLNDYNQGGIINVDDYQWFWHPQGMILTYGKDTGPDRKKHLLEWHHTPQFPSHVSSLVPPQLVQYINDINQRLGAAQLIDVISRINRAQRQ